MPVSYHEFLPSFGRRHGRKLRDSRSSLMNTLLPALKITLSEGLLDSGNVFANTAAPLWVEIGFGAGEHLVEQAKHHPQINFIGCEPYINGMARLLASIQDLKLNNIKLYDGDARLLLSKLPDNSIERLFILFPDPWPKARHHKRRIINQQTLSLIYSKLNNNGLMRIATDHVDYCSWILEQLLAFAQLEWQAQSASDWTDAPKDWITTRYQAKALTEGRKATFLNWIKPPSQ